MKPLQTFKNKKTLQDLRTDINAALAKVKAKYGLGSLEIGTIGYSDTELTTKITAKISVESSPAAAEAIKNQNARAARLLDLPENVVGMKFKRPGTAVFEITQLNLKKRKYPVVAKNLDNNKEYIFTEDVIKMYLEKYLVK